ncbi:MAG: malto-oligosyltrehalose synthase [Thermoanaerobaculia bacterium]
MPRYRVPGSTYRLQLNHTFTFPQATAILDYLRRLGITDVYASPISRATRGSSHGYDVANPQEINPEIGSNDEFEHFAAALRERRMGLLLDIVPNHMAASLENDWWFDLLAKGVFSPYARFFDVDWSPSYGKGQMRNKLLLPVLGRPYGEILGARELRLTLDEHGFSIRYFDHRFPMSAASLRLLAVWLREMIDHEQAAHALSLLAAEEDPRTVAIGILDATPRGSEGRAHLEGLIARVNDGSSTTPHFAELDRLLELQHYRLSFWRMAAEELNYRRFFDISELAGLTIESRETFEAVHRLPLELARRGIVTGLRIDHIDGLRDPIGYLERLRDALPGKRFYVVVEKILGTSEPVREEFALSGTTGYEYLNTINRVFVDAAGLRKIDGGYRAFSERHFSFANVVYRTKRLAIKRLLPGELARLGMRLGALAGRDRVGRDIPFSDLRRALVEISACLPVYRTYVRNGTPEALDRDLVDRAARQARRASPKVLHPAIDFIARSLKLELSEESEPQREEWIDLIMRWQQFTGPAMAKGFEDTALYRANRLLSLNEVGSEPDPDPASLSPEAFHRESAARLARMPHTLNASSTHDTKRSEDVRARLDVLSEMPDRWLEAVERWHRLNEEHRTVVDGRRVPGSNEEWLIYQTLLGAWPLDAKEIPGLTDRLEAYVVKAAREAKMHTSWLEPDEKWEKALVRFARTVADPAKTPKFHADFARLQREIAQRGAVNSLAQLVLKATAPGVPDFYQGCELWDLSLVDPDNRRPVDYARRAEMLAGIRERLGRGDAKRFCGELLRRWRDGRVKLYATHRLLSARNERAALFRDGDYVPLRVTGSRRAHVLAFARVLREEHTIVAVPRLTARLVRGSRFPLGEDVWDDTAIVLPTGQRTPLRNVFTDEIVRGRKSVRAADLFADFPIAVLV